MKIKVVFLSLLAASTSIVVSAQVENDDMYFRSKDRVKLTATQPMKLKSMASEHEVATAVNPTDSYSARNVNPEYISQNKVSSGNTSVDQAPYFIPNYTPTDVNQNLSKSNSSYWNNYNSMAMGGYNPYYSGFSPYGMSSMYSPYSSFYSPFGYGYNPYGFNSVYNSGWSSMISLGFGMGSYYPYSSMAYGSSYWNNYYGYNSYYNMGGYYPGNIIVVNDANSRNIVYGKRSSRSSDTNHYVSPTNRNTTAYTVVDSQGRARGGSRVSEDNSAYYQRGWRTNPETNSAARSTWSGSGDDNSFFRSNSGTNGRGSSNSSFDNNSGSRSWGGNNNSSFSSGGGRSMSSGGGSFGGGSSSGARRGRD